MKLPKAEVFIRELALLGSKIHIRIEYHDYLCWRLAHNMLGMKIGPFRGLY